VVQVGCSPTLFSVTCGVIGLIAGPPKTSRHLDHWVRFICPLQPVVAATDLRTRLGHESETFISGPSDKGRPPLLAVRWPVPRVSPLTPEVTIHSLGSAAFFASPPGWIVFTTLSWVRVYPDGNPSFVPLFSGFRLASHFKLIFDFRRANFTVGNLHLLGNCVQLKSEVDLSILLSYAPRRVCNRAKACS